MNRPRDYSGRETGGTRGRETGTQLVVIKSLQKIEFQDRDSATRSVHGIEVVIASLDSVHFHVLMRCEDQRADHWVGLAKKESAFRAAEEFPELAGGIWANLQKGSFVISIIA